MSRVVITGKVPEPAIEALREAHEVDMHDAAQPITREALLEKVRGADAVISLLTEKVDAELLEAAGSQLQVVANVAVGYNNIDVKACAERGVVATNTPDVLTEATADIAFGLILMATRRLGEGERVIRSQSPWTWGMFYMLGSGLQGKTLGVVGLGAIGAATARRAKAFGMQIVYSSRNACDPALAEELGAARLDMDEMLSTADIISLHCPYSDATHHLMGAEQFGLMKETAYVINTARGPIVDEAALVDALNDGQIAGAGLDVFEKEPTVHEGLLALDNVALVPHLGSATIETRTAMAQLAADNVMAILDGNTPLTPVKT
ncbi:MAG: D-glycerate dehydrogenase [Ornithinimicrobium sp.]